MACFFFINSGPGHSDAALDLMQVLLLNPADLIDC